MSPKTAKTRSDERSADGLTDGEKTFYQAQIRDLEERLERYQRKCDEMEVQQKDLHLKMDHVEKEKKDIVLFLKRTLAKKEDELTDLTETFSKHQQAQETERESFELQLSLLRHELQEHKDRFTAENMALAGKLASLKEFSAQREKLIAERRSLEERLQQQREEHQTAVYNLEKKAVLDNDRLKKEMLQHVAVVAAEFRRVSDQKMPETTMRAMQENLFVTEQLKQLSDRTAELMKENDALRAREKQLKIENGVTEPLLQEITRQNVASQKVVQQLTKKCQQMSSELDKHERLQKEHQTLLENHATASSQLQTLRQKHESFIKQLQQTKAEFERQRRELEEERKLGRQLKAVLQEAATALKEALREVPEEEDTEVQMNVRRNQMMQKLLAVLDSAAAVGEGPALIEFMPEIPQKPTKSPNIKRTDELPLQKSTNHLSHFRTGDLGLVPRKTHSKTGHLSKRVFTNLHK